MLHKEKPVYFVAPADPVVEQFSELFRQFGEADKHTLVMTVHLDMVLNGDVAMLQQMIMALQHYPHLIEKMLFCLDFKFTEVEDSELYLPATYWKTEGEFQRWFNTLLNYPVMLFFINDEDARLYALAGDMLAEGTLQVEPEARGKGGMVAFEGEQLIEVMNRLFTSCWLMLIYCHGSGFNPEPYIQSILADLGLPIAYEEVYNKYRNDISKGIQLRAIAVT